MDTARRGDAPVLRKTTVRGTPVHLEAGIVCSGMNGGTHEKTLEMMELFAREVMPHFREDAHVDETAGVGR